MLLIGIISTIFIIYKSIDNYKKIKYYYKRNITRYYPNFEDNIFKKREFFLMEENQVSENTLDTLIVNIYS